MGKRLEKFKAMFLKAEKTLLKSHVCLSCRRECPDDAYRICERCLSKIRFIKHYCLMCGSPIDENYDFCGKCGERNYSFDSARALFIYDDVTAPIIMRFKYNGYKTYAEPLAQLLADYYAGSDIIANVVTFVPMPPHREKERGYNQAFELSKKFSDITGLPLLPTLVRVKDNVKQATLSAKDRAKNIKDSFAPIDARLIRGRDILLIDDVFTTGATSSECARVLKKSGARSVTVLTLAKTAPDLN